MKIWQWGPSGSLGNFAYGIETPESVFIIDPIEVDEVRFKSDLLSLCESGKNIYLSNTHSHPDHIAHNDSLLDTFAVITYVDHQQFSDGEVVFQSEEDSVTVYKTPGHLVDHVIWVVESGEKQDLIMGDTLFHGGVGNCHSGSATELFHSIQKIKHICYDYSKLYFAHDYMVDNCGFIEHMKLGIPLEILEILRTRKDTEKYIVTSWKQEMLYNPFLQCEDATCFTKLRALRDQW